MTDKPRMPSSRDDEARAAFWRQMQTCFDELSAQQRRAREEMDFVKRETADERFLRSLGIRPR